MKDSEILIEIKSLIDTPEKWTKGAFARNKNYEVVQASSKDACCFCLAGAFRMACRANVAPIAGKRAYDTIIKKIEQKGRRARRDHDRYKTIFSFNDHTRTTHKDIMRFLDELISLTQKQEQQNKNIQWKTNT